METLSLTTIKHTSMCTLCGIAGGGARVVAQKREWTIVKAIASHTTHRRQLTRGQGLCHGSAGCQRVSGREEQKQKHGDFVPRAGQAVPWGILVSCPGPGGVG